MLFFQSFVNRLCVTDMLEGLARKLASSSSNLRCSSSGLVDSPNQSIKGVELFNGHVVHFVGGGTYGKGVSMVYTFLK